MLLLVNPMTRCSTHSLLYETLRWPLSSLLLLFLYDERARVPHFYYREWWWCTGAAVLSPERALFIFSTVRLLAERAHIYQALQWGTLVQELRQQHYQQRPIAQLSLLKCFSEEATNILLLYISNSTLLHQQLFFFFLLFNIFKL